MRYAGGLTKTLLAVVFVLLALPCAAIPENSKSDETIDAKSLKRCLLMRDGATDEERRFGEEMQNALRNSAMGQKILRALLTDCPSKGPVVVEASGFKDSYIFNDHGVENIKGTRATSNDEHSPRIVRYNQLFLQFQNHAAGVSFAAAMLAQEIARMVVHTYLYGSLDNYKDVIGFNMAEEEFARIKGYTVACESSNEVTGAILEATDLVNHTQPFLDRMKLQYSYALMLQQSELRDPLKTYEQRLKDLNARLDEQNRRSREIPVLLDQIDHALHSHLQQLGLRAESIAVLQDQLMLRLQALPNESNETRLAIKSVTEVAAILRGPVGQQTLEKLRNLSYHPVYADVVADYEEGVEALQKVLKTKPLQQPDANHVPMPEETFRQLFDELHPGAPNPPWNDSAKSP